MEYESEEQYTAEMSAQADNEARVQADNDAEAYKTMQIEQGNDKKDKLLCKRCHGEGTYLEHCNTDRGDFVQEFDCDECDYHKDKNEEVK